jgi:deazaflavin-dependent oxidoreductase (nitroreductase family)
MGNTFRGGQVLLLDHRGRRSGKGYTTPVAYARDGEDYVVAASNGGIDREPQWWQNLQAEPRTTIEVRGRRVEVEARLVDDADRARLWDALNDNLDTYDAYQASVSRRIAVIRLSPVTSAA